MKTFSKLTFLIVIISILTLPVKAQFLDRLRDRATDRVEERLEQRAEEEVDEQVDEGMDRLFESLEGENNAGDEESDDAANQARMQRLMQGFGMSGEPVPVADNYNFKNLIQMHIESFNEDGEKISEGEFITHLDPESKSMAYQVVSGDMADGEQGMFIIDAENNAMIILNDENNEKTGIVYGIGTFFQTLGETYEEEASLDETPDAYLANPNVTKTGRSKQIAGYSCDEYVYSDEETESHIWITTDMKMNTRDFFSTLFNTSLYSHGIPWGYMMEVTTEDKESGEKSVMQVTDVDENSNTQFALSDYEITNLGSFQMSGAGESEEE